MSNPTLYLRIAHHYAALSEAYAELANSAPPAAPDISSSTIDEGNWTLAINAARRTFGLSEEQICSPSRQAVYNDARKMIANYLYSCGWTHAAIGNRMGDRDHSSILLMCRKHSDLVLHDTLYAEALGRFMTYIDRFAAKNTQL